MAASERSRSTSLCRQIEMRCNSTHLSVLSDRVAALVSQLRGHGSAVFMLKKLHPSLCYIPCLYLSRTHIKCKHPRAATIGYFDCPLAYPLLKLLIDKSDYESHNYSVALIWQSAFKASLRLFQASTK